MKSFEERWNSIKSDPKKIKKLFMTIWIIAYSMLILGFVLILWVLLFSR